jgi:hypothetical protein
MMQDWRCKMRCDTTDGGKHEKESNAQEGKWISNDILVVSFEK